MWTGIDVLVDLRRYLGTTAGTADFGRRLVIQLDVPRSTSIPVNPWPYMRKAQKPPLSSHAGAAHALVK